MKKFVLRIHLPALLLLFSSLIQVKAQVTTYSFTNCGATGKVGPTQAQVTTAYALTNLSLVAPQMQHQEYKHGQFPLQGITELKFGGPKAGMVPDNLEV